MIRVHGGFGNRMYRLDTDQGSFAVKKMNLVDRRSAYPVDDVLRFERAAFDAGISMPEPISASQHTLVHRWVEGERVPEAPVPAEYGFEIGETLARLHSLDVAWAHASIEDPTRTRLARACQGGGDDQTALGRRTRLPRRDVPRYCSLRRHLRATRARRADPQGHPTVEPARSRGSAGRARLGALGDARLVR